MDMPDGSYLRDRSFGRQVPLSELPAGSNRFTHQNRLAAAGRRRYASADYRMNR